MGLTALMDLVDVRALRIARTRSDLSLAPDERVMGGGTWLFSEPQPGVAGVVDLAGLAWPALEDLPDGGLRIAATCTLVELAESGRHPLFRPACEALLASFKIWEAATVGGNVCLSLPAGAMIALTAGLDGEAVIWRGDAERRLPVEDLVTGVAANALAPGEVLRAIDLPPAALAGRAALRRVALAPLGRSGALLVGRRDADGSFSLTVTAATPRPYVLRFAELPGAGELAAAVDAIDDWYDDPHGAPDWRRAMCLRLAEELREELA